MFLYLIFLRQKTCQTMQYVFIFYLLITYKANKTDKTD